jgi:hypothetical protein
MSFRCIAACLCVVGLSATLWHGTAHATPIDYIEQAVANYSLGGIAGTGAVIVAVSADIIDVVQVAPGIYMNTGIGTVTLADGTTATFVDQLAAFANNPAATLGITDPNSFIDVLDTDGVVGGTYDLSTAVGPLGGSAYVSQGQLFDTSLGAFSLAFATVSSFSATQQPIPEPGSLILLGAGFAMVRCCRRARTPPDKTATAT